MCLYYALLVVEPSTVHISYLVTPSLEVGKILMGFVSEGARVSLAVFLKPTKGSLSLTLPPLFTLHTPMRVLTSPLLLKMEVLPLLVVVLLLLVVLLFVLLVLLDPHSAVGEPTDTSSLPDAVIFIPAWLYSRCLLTLF